MDPSERIDSPPTCHAPPREAPARAALPGRGARPRLRTDTWARLRKDTWARLKSHLDVLWWRAVVVAVGLKRARASDCAARRGGAGRPGARARAGARACVHLVRGEGRDLSG
jgi:hypothetical protein